MIGMFDDLAAVRFGNLPPLPHGYAVVWNEVAEQYVATKRGTDLDLYAGWDRFAARRACIAHDAKHRIEILGPQADREGK